MTKAELEKEADEYSEDTRFIDYSNYSLSENINISDEIKEAYLAGAEPREKRIAELEKENAELQETLGKCAKMPVLYCLGAKETITEAKEIIKIMRYLLFDAWGYISFPFKERVDKFLTEVEK